MLIRISSRSIRPTAGRQASQLLPADPRSLVVHLHAACPGPLLFTWQPRSLSSKLTFWQHTVLQRDKLDCMRDQWRNEKYGNLWYAVCLIVQEN